MNRTATVVWLSAVAWAACGCAGRTHRLVADDHSGRVIGSIHHEGPEKASMVLEYGGKRFEGDGFVIRRDQDLAELRRIYGSSSKRFDRISFGADTDHYLYSAEPVLKAVDGTTMNCRLRWQQGLSPAGVCVASDGTAVAFRSE